MKTKSMEAFFAAMRDAFAISVVPWVRGCMAPGASEGDRASRTIPIWNRPLLGKLLIKIEPVRSHSLSWRQALAIAIGNGLQFYDVVTYAFFATQIGRTFFPSKPPA